MNGYIAVDIGGTDIKSGLVDDQLNFLSIHSEASDAPKGGGAIVKQVKKIISNIIESTTVNILGIGISTAGVVDTQNKKIIFANQNIPNYVGIDFQKEIGNFFDLPMAIDNDVNCAVIGEQAATFKENKDDFILFAFGTGIGCGIWINQKLYQGSRMAAGNVGDSHVGGRVFERQCSTAALVRRSQMKFPNLLIQNGKDVYNLADENKSISNFLEEYYTEIAEWLTVYVDFMDVSSIIIGGGISKNPDFMKGITNAFVKINTGKFTANTKIIPAKLGNNAGMIGAVKNLIVTELGEKNE